MNKVNILCMSYADDPSHDLRDEPASYKDVRCGVKDVHHVLDVDDVPASGDHRVRMVL